MNRGKSLLSIDLRFLEIKGEFIDLRAFFGFIGKQVPIIITNHKKKVEKDIEEFDEEGFVRDSFRNTMESYHEEYVSIRIPRYYFNPIIQILYAICEASIRDIAEYWQKKLNCKIALDDLAGGFVTKANNYYSKVLGIGPLFRKTQHSKRFKIVYALRNAIAHANGRLDMLTPENRKAVQKFAKSEAGIEIDQHFLIVSEEFIADSIQSMEEAIWELTERTPKE